MTSSTPFHPARPKMEFRTSLQSRTNCLTSAQSSLTNRISKTLFLIPKTNPWNHPCSGACPHWSQITLTAATSILRNSFTLIFFSRVATCFSPTLCSKPFPKSANWPRPTPRSRPWPWLSHKNEFIQDGLGEVLWPVCHHFRVIGWENKSGKNMGLALSRRSVIDCL